MVQVQTIDELEALYYGHNRNLLRKADAPVTTSTAGTFNAIFGAYAWAQLNLEANAFGILPKYPWDKSGWRVITAKPTLNTNSCNTALGGTAEGGTIAETIKPTIQELDVRPKTAQLPFSASEVMEWLATHSKDDIWGGLGSLRLYMAVQHKEFLNRMLLADVEGSVASGAFAGTTDFESLDRIISSNAEESALGGSGSGYYDPWAANATVDRDSSSTFDSTVESASGTIGTNGVLTDDTLRTFLRKIRIAAGKDPNVFLGSHEVYSEIQGLYMPSVRIPNPYGESLVQVDVNGIQTFKGTGVGIHVDSIYGIPFIPTKDAPSDSGDASEVGRLFALDTSDAEGYGYPRIGIQIAIPTEYYEATRRTPAYPFVNNAFVEKGVFRTMGETVCRHFKSQGKIRDIKL
tara:strand:+ start:603 stop:1817 length:1215 start_codon:yes stop_codon:yes gene_type:complete